MNHQSEASFFLEFLLSVVLLAFVGVAMIPVYVGARDQSNQSKGALMSIQFAQNALEPLRYSPCMVEDTIYYDENGLENESLYRYIYRITTKRQQDMYSYTVFVKDCLTGKDYIYATKVYGGMNHD